MKIGHPKQRTRRCPQCFWIKWAGRPLQKENAGRAEGLGGPHDRAAIARILQSIQHHYHRASAKQLFQFPLGRLHQRQHTLGRLGSGNALQQRIRRHYDFDAAQATHMRFRRGAHRFGCQHQLHFAIAAKRFFQQVERFSDTPSLLGKAASGNRPPNVLEQGIGCARNRFGLRHFTIRF